MHEQNPSYATTNSLMRAVGTHKPEATMYKSSDIIYINIQSQRTIVKYLYGRSG